MPTGNSSNSAQSMVCGRKNYFDSKEFVDCSCRFEIVVTFTFVAGYFHSCKFCFQGQGGKVMASLKIILMVVLCCVRTRTRPATKCPST